MKKRRVMSLLLCAAMMASTLSVSAAESAKVQPNDVEETKEGEKVLKYAITAEPETLDPGLNNYMASSSVIQNLFMGLYQVGPDGSLINGCADSYTLSEDGLTYTFTLKEDLKWSDGSALTAGDFEYAWKRALAPETASPGAWYLFYVKNGEAYNSGEAEADEVGVKALDDKTLEVTLENPTAYFLDLTAVTVFFPVKKDIVEAETPWTKSGDTYVCNGAFKIQEINPQESYILAKNENYEYVDDVHLDEVDLILIESAEAALSAFNAGEIDMTDNVSTQAATQYAGAEELQTFDLIGTAYYDFNCSKEALSDPRVRKALSISLDRETLLNAVDPSKPKAAYAFVPYGIPYGDTNEQYRDVVGDLITEDVEEAKALLAEAGYPNGEGFPTLTFITQNNQLRKDIAQVMQAMWKQNLGINVEIVTYESKVYWDEQTAGNFDICYDGWTGDYPDPSTNLECFIAARNYDQCRWSGELADQYNDLMMENRSLKDNAQRAENFATGEKILMDEMPIIPLSYRNSQLLVSTKVTGVIKSYIGHTLFKFGDIEA
ncbi:MAG: peptide ABC transporter substrate-binding protein [Lachnospiraceae bacterium]|nr:peptide ABC transporter substrate-binding protein [Lachnospiraceae bacterium]